MITRSDSSSLGTDPVSLSDDVHTVEIRKVITRNGERLEIATVDTTNRIQIDPLGLESLSWQHPRELAQLLRSEYMPSHDNTESGSVINDLELVNEFSHVMAHHIRANGDDFLDIIAPEIGHKIRLPPSILAALSEHDTHLFSQFLETPFGPDDH